jgi:hypothetical protein
VTGDGWATGLVADLYGACGIYYVQTPTRKSDFYLDLLGLLSSRRLLMLDQPQQRLELLGLERRVAWGGRDTIDHPALAGAHDDAVNALAGAAVLAATARGRMVVTPEALNVSRGLGTGGGRFSPETLSMAALAGIPVDVDAGPDGRPRKVSAAALATSRGRFSSPRPSYGDRHQGSVDQFAIAQMLRGRR